MIENILQVVDNTRRSSERHDRKTVVRFEPRLNCLTPSSKERRVDDMGTFLAIGSLKEKNNNYAVNFTVKLVSRQAPKAEI